MSRRRGNKNCARRHAFSDRALDPAKHLHQTLSACERHVNVEKLCSKFSLAAVTEHTAEPVAMDEVSA